MAAQPSDADDLRLLEVGVATSFALSASGRIERENGPDNSAGPRLFFAGCTGGNLIRLRRDVSEEVAQRARSLAESEPPWLDPSAPPQCLAALVELLSAEAAVEAADPVLIYRLPNGVPCQSSSTIIRSDATDGQRLLAHLASTGMPSHLVEAGFVGPEDFWEPWCAAMIGGEIAAIAFAARIGSRGMEVGVYTFPGHRGRGLAAAVTADWSSLPGVADRVLFYSTSRANLSSRRVAQRLGLRRIGVSVRIG